MASTQHLHTAPLSRFPQPYTNRLFRRAIALWFIVRLAMFMLVLLMVLMGGNFSLDVPLVSGSAQIAVATTMVVVGLAAIDLIVTREKILIANLGVSFTRALSLVAVIAFVLELVVIAGTRS